jgi:quercetin dioxygenase-like cupin family protein
MGQKQPGGYGKAIVHADLEALETTPSKMVVYDREIGVRMLYEDPNSGAEHYLIRYPPGLKAKLHRHTAAHTIVLLSGVLEVNGRVMGPGSYCHFPAGEAMLHAPADDEGCSFINIFHGPADVEALE